MKASNQKPGNLYPEVINASFELSNIIKKYELLLTSDSQVAFLLNYIDESLQSASLGDATSLKKLIREGAGILDKIVKLLQHDALEEQTEDDESLAILSDDCRLGLDYLELRKELLAFKSECFFKVQSIKG